MAGCGEISLSRSELYVGDIGDISLYLKPVTLHTHRKTVCNVSVTYPACQRVTVIDIFVLYTRIKLSFSSSFIHLQADFLH